MARYASYTVQAGTLAQNITITSGGSMSVYGTATRTTFKNNGWMDVSSGGKATSTTFTNGGVMWDSGTATRTTFSSGGVMWVSGAATSTTFKNGGSMYVDGTASRTTFSSGGVMFVSGAATSTTLKNGGSMYVDGKATSTTLTRGGYMHVYGTATDTTLTRDGRLIVFTGGKAVRTTFASEGVMWVSGTATSTTFKKGGSMDVSAGGKATKTTFSSGGSLSVYSGGSALRTTFTCGGVMWVSGTVTSTTFKKGGSMEVYAGGKAVLTTLNSGASLSVYAGGSTLHTTVNSGGSMYVEGRVTSATVRSGGALTLDSPSATKVVISSGALVTLLSNAGALKANAVTLRAGASMGLTGYTSMGSRDLKGRTLVVSGQANKLSKMTTNDKTNIVYDIRNASAGANTSAMLRCTAKKNYAGNYGVSVSKKQAVGTYVLSDNIALAKGKAFTIKTDTATQGTAKLNGTALVKNGFSYTVSRSTGSNTRISLTVDLRAGKMLKGTDKKETLAGASHCDVFYGGKGNDTIKGANGWDVAVYDTIAWGKDVIQKTSGAMTLLFKGMTEKDITTKKSGSKMVITRNGFKNQQITINGWNDDTHEIVYAGTSVMTAFDSYRKATTPTTAQKTAARNEVWSRAGLASA